jgi:hypothetical protein
MQQAALIMGKQTEQQIEEKAAQVAMVDQVVK